MSRKELLNASLLCPHQMNGPYKPILISNHQHTYALCKLALLSSASASTLIYPLYKLSITSDPSTPNTTTTTLSPTLSHYKFEFIQQILIQENPRNFDVSRLFYNKIENQTTLVESRGHQALFIYHRYVSYPQLGDTFALQYKHIFGVLLLNCNNDEVKFLQAHDLSNQIPSEMRMLQIINHGNQCRVYMKQPQTAAIHHFVCNNVFAGNNIEFQHMELPQPSPLADHILLACNANNNNNTNTCYSIESTLFMNSERPRAPPRLQQQQHVPPTGTGSAPPPTSASLLIFNLSANKMLKKELISNSPYAIEFACNINLQGSIWIIIDNNGRIFMIDLEGNTIKYIRQIFVGESVIGPFIPILISTDPDSKELIICNFIRKYLPAHMLKMIPKYIFSFIMQWYCYEELFLMLRKSNHRIYQYKIIDIQVNKLIEEYYRHKQNKTRKNY